MPNWYALIVYNWIFQTYHFLNRVQPYSYGTIGRTMNVILPETERMQLRRMRERGHFDRGTIYSILDAMPMCHIGYVLKGSPVVMPTFQWREGDHVYWHASSGGRKSVV